MIDLTENLEPAPAQFEERCKATLDKFLEVNLETEDEPQQTLISGNMCPEEKEVYVPKENRDVFSLITYTEMPGSDLKNMHALSICRPRQTVSSTIVEMDVPRPIFQNRTRG